MAQWPCFANADPSRQNILGPRSQADDLATAQRRDVEITSARSSKQARQWSNARGVYLPPASDILRRSRLALISSWSPDERFLLQRSLSPRIPRLCRTGHWMGRIRATSGLRIRLAGRIVGGEAAAVRYGRRGPERGPVPACATNDRGVSAQAAAGSHAAQFSRQCRIETQSAGVWRLGISRDVGRHPLPRPHPRPLSLGVCAGIPLDQGQALQATHRVHRERVGCMPEVVR